MLPPLFFSMDVVVTKVLYKNILVAYIHLKIKPGFHQNDESLFVIKVSNTYLPYRYYLHLMYKTMTNDNTKIYIYFR